MKGILQVEYTNSLLEKLELTEDEYRTAEHQLLSARYTSVLLGDKVVNKDVIHTVKWKRSRSE